MRILVAVPTFESIYPDTFQSIYELDPCGHELIFRFVRGYDVATARNHIVETAQNLGADYILMVDNDVVIQRETIRYFCEDLKDVCLGFYAHRNHENRYEGTVNACKLGEFNYTDQYTEQEIRQMREEGITKFEIHGGGMGCAFIKVSVFDELKYPWYDWVNYDDDNNRGLLSEDLYFCEQCKWNKIPIYSDTRIGPGHIFRYVQNVI